MNKHPIWVIFLFIDKWVFTNRKITLFDNRIHQIDNFPALPKIASEKSSIFSLIIYVKLKYIKSATNTCHSNANSMGPLIASTKQNKIENASWNDIVETWIFRIIIKTPSPRTFKEIHSLIKNRNKSRSEIHWDAKWVVYQWMHQKKKEEDVP